MSEPFLAEIRMVGFNFAPNGWTLCDGQILPINQNQSLYSLLGTTYGGDGRTSFALPDLRGRTPIHAGAGHNLGQKSGEETHTLTVAEMPEHTHEVKAYATGSVASNVPTATNNVLSVSTPANIYNDTLESLADLSAGTLVNMGGSQAHDNMQPYLAVNFCIALQGLFPSRN
ncbi:tail fiber protein [Marinilongibacter aquaticus]|uniref:phage tail protein n=1 Tax=Marinilongibacter aquaticus TaxID=2975157 RepID=UPI0021BDDC1A|nr:tail fiber protein [Marinilongibacter aquaticus]UBM59617.1 tail fiber protein [Marinilongibacter aquaticus]